MNLKEWNLIALIKVSVVIQCPSPMQVEKIVSYSIQNSFVCDQIVHLYQAQGCVTPQKGLGSWKQAHVCHEVLFFV